MQKTHTLFYLILFICYIHLNPLQAQPNIALDAYATGLVAPVDIKHAGDDRLFIVQQTGQIQIIDNSGNVLSTPFLDISSHISTNGFERGLLGMAFHPNYANNGYFYVNYTDNLGATQIARFTVSTNPNVADVNSELLILNIPQPFKNHNAGDLAFGPDGYLYIGTGDGGSGGDPGNRSQNPLNLLGKMLRIDVDGGTPYAIPPANPFVGNAAVADEIWALGLRNPWRYNFDTVTGDLWISDVGQDDWEEINVQLANSTGGENYGWKCYEGTAIFDLSPSECNNPIGTITDPVFEYTHDNPLYPTGGCSVTGGYMYRGSQIPDLYGYYVFNDYCSGNFWATTSNGMGGYETQLITKIEGDWTTFGVNNTGELYLADAGIGTIYQIIDPCSSPIPPSNCTPTLSLKVILEACFNSSNNLMNSQLRANNLLPITQPFTASPWSYNSTIEQVNSLNDIPSNAIDWLLVELWTDENTLFAQRAVFLLDDGSIADTDGLSAGAVFVNAINGDTYYIVIRARNHLAVVSSTPITFTNNVAQYDFTTSATQALGTNQLTNVASGIYALHAGDIDANGIITVMDFNKYVTQLAGATDNQYLTADVSLDGQITVDDFNAYRPNASQIGISWVRY